MDAHCQIQWKVLGPPLLRPGISVWHSWSSFPPTKHFFTLFLDHHTLHFPPASLTAPFQSPLLIPAPLSSLALWEYPWRSFPFWIKTASSRRGSHGTPLFLINTHSFGSLIQSHALVLSVSHWLPSLYSQTLPLTWNLLLDLQLPPQTSHLDYWNYLLSAFLFPSTFASLQCLFSTEVWSSINVSHVMSLLCLKFTNGSFLGLPEWVNKNTRCPVTFKFQLSNKWLCNFWVIFRSYLY